MARSQFSEYASDGGGDAPYGMKLTSIAALLFAVQIASVPALADGTIKEVGYPAEYDVAHRLCTTSGVQEGFSGDIRVAENSAPMSFRRKNSNPPTPISIGIRADDIVATAEPTISPIEDRN